MKTKPTILHHYNDKHHNLKSPNLLVPLIIETIGFLPKSVVDFGCGLGQWLHVFRNSGVNEVLGIDGPHVPLEDSFIENKEFQTQDLFKPEKIKLSKKYDLAVTMEVGEHLPKNCAKSFVNLLCNSTDIIVFSAAIPGQTGENHYNEQDPFYWKELFKDNDFVMLDPFRKLIWNNPEISWWYRQNLVLFVNKSIIEKFSNLEIYENFYVHPELFRYKESILNQYMNRSIFSMIKNQIKKMR